MVYGLPARGEVDWNTKLDASIAAVKATADAALSTAQVDTTVAANMDNAASQTHARTLALVATQLTDVASTEDLMQSGPVGTDSIAAAISYPLMVARIPLQVIDFSLVCLAAVAASDVNYWTVELRKYSGGALSVIGSKTTKVTGGAAIANATDWNFNGVTLANNTFAVGDVFTVAFTPTGAPTALNRPGYSFRMAPV